MTPWKNHNGPRPVSGLGIIINNHHNHLKGVLDRDYNGASIMLSPSPPPSPPSSITSPGLFYDNKDGKACCLPIMIECLTPRRPIDPTNYANVVRISCSNVNCNQGRYAHVDCYNMWEKLLYTYLVASNPTLEWTDIPDVWSNAAYRLIADSCECRCLDGYLRKDDDWYVFTRNANNNVRDTAIGSNRRPDTTVGRVDNGLEDGVDIVGRMNNMNLTVRADVSDDNDNDGDNDHVERNLLAEFPLTANNVDFWNFLDCTKVLPKELNLYDSMTGSGVFYSRDSYDTLKTLSEYRLNRYNIKTADEGTVANDDGRTVVLELLFEQRRNKLNCILCSVPLKVYSAYPLVDGVLFFSPIKRSYASIQVTLENKICYLNAVCAHCTDPYSVDRRVICNICSKSWNGSSFIIGSVYFFDILASNICCNYKLQCTHCAKPIPSAEFVSKFSFSGYSTKIVCPHCNVFDYHFIKPLTVCYRVQTLP